MATRLSQATPAICGFFNEIPNPVLRQRDIAEILAEHRDAWRLAESTGTTQFIKYLISTGNLRRWAFKLPHRAETLFVWGKVSRLAIASSIKTKGYLSHQTAMYLHQLLDKEPQTIYVNHEQRPLPPPRGPLVQSSIDNAFRRPQRITKNHAPLGKHTMYVLNGKHTGDLGVISTTDLDGRSLRVTGLERTLIDITIRPSYTGSPSDVLEAYRRGYGRYSVSSLANMLKQMSFIYPYHQAVGFYLERTGLYSEADLSLFRDPQFTHDFYLCYAMKEKSWRMYYPDNL